ncbi:MAG: SRPBCC domain-containing protein [Flavobacteriales bacterium]|nr:SRPBCC domain-containing protein [Flavobacteriales bacterium]
MKTSNTVYVSREFNCTKSKLFEWITQPDLISKWFGPKHLSVKNVTNELRVNGNYNIEMIKPDGSTFIIGGKYLEIEEPNKLKFSFAYVGLAETPPESTVEIILEEINATQTKLSLIQKFETVPADMENRTKAWEGMFFKLTGLI